MPPHPDRHSRQPAAHAWLIAALLTSATAARAAEPSTAELVEAAIARAAAQVGAAVAELKQLEADTANDPDPAKRIIAAQRFPQNTITGRVGTPDGSWNYGGVGFWASGQFPAQMWSLHRLGAPAPTTGSWAELAKAWGETVRSRAVDVDLDDIAVNNVLCFGPWYDASAGSERAAQLATILSGAAAIAAPFAITTSGANDGKWHADLGCWGYERRPDFDISGTPANERNITYWHAFADHSPNALQLIWAADHVGDASLAADYRAKALTHLRTLGASIADRAGGTWQRGFFDQGVASPASPVRDDPGRPTGFAFGQHKQGYGLQTTWSRGQGWILFALATTWAGTGASDILEQLKTLLAYHEGRTGADPVPPWDYDYAAIDPGTHRDSSAAALMAAGLLRAVAAMELAHPDRPALLASAERILRRLCQSPYLTASGDPERSILRRGCYVHPLCPDARGGAGAPDCGTVWGDAFFLDALATWRSLPSAPVPTIVLSAPSVDVPEGGTVTFTVELSAQPSTSTSLSVAHASSGSGDADLSVSAGASLVFTTANWDVPQTVTLTAADDADAVNGSADFTIGGSGLAQVTITATEVDDDSRRVIALAAVAGHAWECSTPADAEVSSEPNGEHRISLLPQQTAVLGLIPVAEN